MSEQAGQRHLGDRRRGRLYAVLFYPGACALALVMLTEAGAVTGRHLGLPIIGSIEVVQAAILVAACSALVSATLAGSHARVHLLLERLGEDGRRRMLRASAALAAGFFAVLTVGSVWIAMDLWYAHEESEVLRLPYRPLRLVTIAAAGLVAFLFLRQAVTGREPAPAPAQDAEQRGEGDARE